MLILLYMLFMLFIFFSLKILLIYSHYTCTCCLNFLQTRKIADNFRFLFSPLKINLLITMFHYFSPTCVHFNIWQMISLKSECFSLIYLATFLHLRLCLEFTVYRYQGAFIVMCNKMQLYTYSYIHALPCD